MSNPQAAQQVMIRLRAILDLYDDADIAAGIKLLDEGSRASLSALAGPYAELRTKTGKVITEAEIEGWVAEAERGYDLETVRAALRAQSSADFAPPGYYRDESGLHRQHDVHGGPHDEPASPPHPELGPGSGHQADGPEDCARCQLLRENAHWTEHMLVPHRHSHAGARSGPMAVEPHSHLHSHGGEHHKHEHRHEGI